MSIDQGPSREELLRQFVEDHGLTGLELLDLNLALTHRSYAYEAALVQDNERLEFLGDAVISAVTSEFLYQKDPAADEGQLSKRRAQMVSRTQLGQRALALGLGSLILLGRGERDTGGARRHSILGSALEAVVGIAYLRLGFTATRTFVCRHILEALQQHNLADPVHGDYKSALQEWTQQHLKLVPSYVRQGEAGPDHAKLFYIRVEVAGRPLATAGGSRVKTAENEAARQALAKLQAGEFEF